MSKDDLPDFKTVLGILGGREDIYLLIVNNGDPWVVLNFVDRSTSEALQQVAPPVFQDDSKIKDLLRQAAISRDFDQIRQYMREVLASQRQAQKLASANKRPVMGLRGAFHSDYVGGAVDGLVRYLSKCNEIFIKGTSARYYSKHCSIVQSSGTGKSRTVIELANRDVLVVYINIRAPADTNSYPPRDTIPADILADNLDCPKDEYSDRCVAFFHALFDTLLAYLSKIAAKDDDRSKIIETWSKGMCTMESGTRTSFFIMLKKKFNTIFAAIQSQRKNWDYVGAELIGGNEMVKAYMNLVEELPQLFSDQPNLHSPKMVIAFDEAHTLGDPARGLFQPPDIFCRAISEFSTSYVKVSNWVVFVSTAFAVANFSAPAKVYPSRRISELFAPYVLLGWDQKVPALEDLEPQSVARFDHIVGYGRPLWSSLMSSAGTVHTILDTAGVKLCKSQVFKASWPSQALAVLGQRFCLDVRFGDRKAVGFQRQLVSDHLRICVDTTQDRIWQNTLYPSEPLLSCASSELIHARPDNLRASLDCLKSEINYGLIDIGTRGELVSRLILLFAKDLCIRQPALGFLGTKYFNYAWKEELLDCRPLPVVDFLAFLFGENCLDTSMKELFQDWYIDFSHWVPMDKSIRFGKGCLSPEDWIKRLWYRTTALQCCPDQAVIDKVIPMYRLDPPSESGSASPTSLKQLTSYILISDRAGPSGTPSSLDSISPKRALGVKTDNPYIAIHLDLRADSGPPNFTLAATPKDGTSLRIYAPGIGTDTYPFLKEIPDVMPLLKDLVHLADNPKTLSREDALLQDRMLYGSTSEARHMLWETDTA